MTHTKVSLTIEARVSVVFGTIADISNYSRAVPQIERVEFLTEKRTGAGARFRETRRMGKRTATTEQEVTEFVEDDRVGFRSDAGGTIWDSLFTVAPGEDGKGTRLDLVMEARPYRLISRLLVPLMKPMVAKAVVQDMVAVKAFCERA